MQCRKLWRIIVVFLLFRHPCLQREAHLKMMSRLEQRIYLLGTKLQRRGNRTTPIVPGTGSRKGQTDRGWALDPPSNAPQTPPAYPTHLHPTAPYLPCALVHPQTAPRKVQCA